MAPKRRSASRVTVTKKTVQQTVKVVVTPQGKEDDESQLLSSETLDVLTDTQETFTDTQEDQEPQIHKTVEVTEKVVDDDETQPLSQPENIPPAPASKKPAPQQEQESPPETPQKNESLKGKGKGTKAVKKTGVKGEGRKKKRQSRGRAGGEGGEGYKRYVFRVLKQVHPDVGISGKAMTIVNNYMADMFERLADEAAKLQKYGGRMTMSAREVQAAVKLVLPGELGKHAIAEGTKAVSSYVSYSG